MFVTTSNFDDAPYEIPNLDKVINTFATFLETQERDALLKLLGRQLYTAFIAGLAALPDAFNEEDETVIDQEYVYGNDIWKALTIQTGIAPVEGADWEVVEEGNKWLLLKNGADYEYNSLTYQWGGMDALLTPYVYSKWLEKEVSRFTGNGVVAETTENSERVSSNVMICRSYNAFATLAGDYFCELYTDTLYGFLYEDYISDEPVYENWKYVYPEPLNEFDF